MNPSSKYVVQNLIQSALRQNQELFERINVVPAPYVDQALIKIATNKARELTKQGMFIHPSNYVLPSQYKRLLQLALNDAPSGHRQIELCEFWSGEISDLERIITEIELGEFPRPYRTQLNAIYWLDLEVNTKQGQSNG